MSRIAMTFVFTLLLCGLTLSLELCDLNAFNSYLEAYPMKCGSDCDEYKKWVVKMVDEIVDCTLPISRRVASIWSPSSSTLPIRWNSPCLLISLRRIWTGVMDVKQKHSEKRLLLRTH